MLDVLLAAVIATSSPAPAGVDAYAYEVGDDDGNGIISEDESGWSCVDMGNKVCGPNNSNGVPAARRSNRLGPRRSQVSAPGA
jgi:hypothetical protein